MGIFDKGKKKAAQLQEPKLQESFDLILSRNINWVRKLPSVALNDGYLYGASNAQADIEVLMNASVTLNSEELLSWVCLTAAMISMNTLGENVQDIDQSAQIFMDSANFTKVLVNKLSSNPLLAVRVQNLSLAMIKSVEVNPEFEAIMLKVRDFAIERLNEE